LAKSGKEYALAIRIAGEIDKSLLSSTGLTKKELSAIARQAAYSANSMGASFDAGFALTEKGFSNIEKAAKESFKIVEKTAGAAVVAIAATATAATKAGISYESAFAGVKKTTEATAGEYASLSNEILGMTRDIPATANEIAEVAEAAGQLGIQKENLLDFTDVMIDLGESTNLTATEGASDLAKFANITQMAADKYSNLGSVIVELGNNFATTESDIVSMAMNIASTGELTDLTEAQIMGISAALSSVGLEADAGGTAMSKLLKKIQVAVETGSSDLNDYAKVAGMTTDQFKKSFQDDAVVALSSFIDGLKDTEKNGKSATVILEDMGLTEVRLSNTILSLANSSGLMSKAVDMANDAWEDNTALSEEAAKRYETMESKIQIFKNGLTSTGIKLYEEYSEPLGDAIDAGSEFVNQMQDELLPTLIEDFKNELPTIIREVKSFGKGFMEFADPVIDVGEWMVAHPDVIKSFLVGIGSALAAYKVEQGIATLTKSFIGLGAVLTNPYALAITGVALAIGGTAGIASYVAKAEKELKDKNLAEHFGDIALSLDDIQTVVSRMLRTDDLGKLSEAMSAIDDLDGFSESIDSSLKELNKYNWKVGIGLELDEDEQSAYKSYIEDFISNSEDLILQNQYAVSLALELYTGDGSTSDKIKEQVNQFYQDTYNEVSDLGTKLQEATNAAFEDGLLDVDEAKIISDYTSQISSITEKIANAEFQAGLDAIQARYSGSELTPDAYKNMMAEFDEQIEASKADYLESYKYTMSNYRMMLNDGSITQAEFDSYKDMADNNFNSQIAGLENTANEFAYNTIIDTYGDVIDGFSSFIEHSAGDSIAEQISKISKLENDGDAAVIEQVVNLLNGSGVVTDIAAPLQWDAIRGIFETYSGADQATKDALGDLFSTMQPYIESLVEQQNAYVSEGEEIPDWLSEKLEYAYLIGSLAGDDNSIWHLLGSYISEDNELSDLYDKIISQGIAAPPELTKAFDQSQATDNEESIYKLSGLFGLSSSDFTTSGFLSSMTPEIIMGNVANSTDNVNTVLDDLSNSQTGGSTITYSPSYTFNGDAPTKDDLVNASRISQEEFNDMMEQYEHDNFRFLLRK